MYAEPLKVDGVDPVRTLIPVNGADLPSVRAGVGAGSRATAEPAVQSIPTPTAFQGAAIAMLAVIACRVTCRLRAA